MHTSSARSNRAVNSAITILNCSLPGTYALPLKRKTERFSTNSGTLSQSTLYQVSSSVRRNPGVACTSLSESVRLSSSLTDSQSRLRLSIKVRLSLESSCWNRNRKSIVSARANRRRRSSVPEKANRRIKCE